MSATLTKTGMTLNSKVFRLRGDRCDVNWEWKDGIGLNRPWHRLQGQSRSVGSFVRWLGRVLLNDTPSKLSAPWPTQLSVLVQEPSWLRPAPHIHPSGSRL